MRKILPFLTFGFLILVFLLIYHLYSVTPTPYLIINDHKLFVEIADSPDKIAQGLSNREFLTKDRGMIFIFPQIGNYPFWMKGMIFSLDFIFIKDQTVIDLVENVPFPKEGELPRTIVAKENFNKVLEVNQGMIKEIGVDIGDQLEFFF